jgi:hypothetical protein
MLSRGTSAFREREEISSRALRQEPGGLYVEGNARKEPHTRHREEELGGLVHACPTGQGPALWPTA